MALDTSTLTSFTIVSLQRAGYHRDLLSFPTRRSSDLFWPMFVGCRFANRMILRVAVFGSTSVSSSGPMPVEMPALDRKSTRLDSSHVAISYAVFCLKKNKKNIRDDVKYQILNM